MVAYCTASPPLCATVWFNSVVQEVAADLIQNPAKDGIWHFYFRTCLEYWKKAYARYRTFYLVAQAMLSSALKSNVLDYGDVARMEEELRDAAPYHDANNRAISSAMTTFGVAQTGASGPNVEVLATQLDELFTLHELTKWGESD